MSNLVYVANDASYQEQLQSLHASIDERYPELTVAQRAQIEADLYNETFPYGKLQPLIDDEDVCRINISSAGINPQTGALFTPHTTVVTRHGTYLLDKPPFEGAQEAFLCAEKLCERAGVHPNDNALKFENLILPDGCFFSAVFDANRLAQNGCDLLVIEKPQDVFEQDFDLSDLSALDTPASLRPRQTAAPMQTPIQSIPQSVPVQDVAPNISQSVAPFQSITSPQSDASVQDTVPAQERHGFFRRKAKDTPKVESAPFKEHTADNALQPTTPDLAPAPYVTHTVAVDKALLDAVRQEVQMRITSTNMSTEVVERIIEEEVNRFASKDTADKRKEYIRRIADEFLRFGVLQPLMDDENVSEIQVFGGGRDCETGAYLRPRVVVEIDGVLHPAPDVELLTEEQHEKLVSRIARLSGRTCDETSPLMDATLPDGSHVNAVHHSIAIDGQTLNIRKFVANRASMQDLVSWGSASADMMDFLRACVVARANIIVAGGTDSGKTTLLNILSGCIPSNQSVVVIEDTAELQLKSELVQRLQSRPKNAEGAGEVSLHSLLVNALRMRPDRIVVGECRSIEALDMLQAMSTGHDGSLTTVHASSAKGVFARIETMIQTGTTRLDTDAIRRQIADAIDLVVYTTRLRSGRRVIQDIVAIDGYAEGQITRTELFHVEVSPDAQTVRFVPNGLQPVHLKEKILNSGAVYKPEWFFLEGRY